MPITVPLLSLCIFVFFADDLSQMYVLRLVRIETGRMPWRYDIDTDGVRVHIPNRVGVRTNWGTITDGDIKLPWNLITVTERHERVWVFESRTLPPQRALEPATSMRERIGRIQLLQVPPPESYRIAIPRAAFSRTDATNIDHLIPRHNRRG